MGWSWTKYSTCLDTEWKQLKTEGHDVDVFYDICNYVAKRAGENDGEDWSVLATELGKMMNSTPVKEDFTFVEPSDLEGIRAERPAQTVKLPPIPAKEVLRDKVSGAWIGRMAGCLLGKPIEGMRTPQIYDILKSTNNYPLSRFICKKEFPQDLLSRWEGMEKRCWADTIGGISPSDDDTNYTTFGLKLVDEIGKNFTAQDVIDAWCRWIPVSAVCTAERVAYLNAVMNKKVPETATYQNPFREYIGAQIRADFFGYVNPGNPELAAEMGFRDASISHIKNGIYGEMWVAAMLAAAGVCDDVETVLRAGLEQVPANSRFTADVQKVIDWYHEGVSAEEATKRIQTIFDEFHSFDWCYTNSNAMIVTLGLLYGQKDIGKSMCLAVQVGFDTDCNGATVGSIVGMMIGEKKIPAEWFAPFQKNLKTSIDGYAVVNSDIMADKTMELIDRDH